MSTAPSFPGETVISSFTQLEAMFQEVLGHIPYVPEHEDVWSPSLITILLEACSQLDSLWKFTANNTPGVVLPPSGQNLTITHYFQYFGQGLAHQWAVLWAQDGKRLEPFSSWQNPTYVPMGWWTAYNAVKHDRLVNRNQATMKHAAHAMAALFIVIVTYSPSLPHLARAGWVKKSVKPTSGLLLQGQPAELKFAESNLVSYLVEVDKKSYSGTRKQEVGTYGSYRFYLWIRDNMPHLDFDYG